MEMGLSNVLLRNIWKTLEMEIVLLKNTVKSRVCNKAEIENSPS